MVGATACRGPRRGACPAAGRPRARHRPGPVALGAHRARRQGTGRCRRPNVAARIHPAAGPGATPEPSRRRRSAASTGSGHEHRLPDHGRRDVGLVRRRRRSAGRTARDRGAAGRRTDRCVRRGATGGDVAPHDADDAPQRRRPRYRQRPRARAHGGGRRGRGDHCSARPPARSGGAQPDRRLARLAVGTPAIVAEPVVHLGSVSGPLAAVLRQGPGEPGARRRRRGARCAARRRGGRAGRRVLRARQDPRRPGRDGGGRGGGDARCRRRPPGLPRAVLEREPDVLVVAVGRRSHVRVRPRAAGAGSRASSSCRPATPASTRRRLGGRSSG